LISLVKEHSLEDISEACWQFGISPDGQFLAVAKYSRPEVIDLCNLQGKVFKTLEGHKGMIHSISFSQDGRAIASASLDKTVRIWSPTGELYTIFDRFDSSVESVAFAPQVPILAGGEQSGMIVLFDIGGNHIATFRSPKNRIYCLSWAPDNNMFAAASADGKLYLYNISNQNKRTFEHPGPVYGVAFSPSNGQGAGSRKILSTCEDGAVRLINLEEQTSTLIKAHSSRSVGIASTSDGLLFATASFDKSVRLFDRYGNPKGELQFDSEALGVNFSPDTSRLFVSTRNRQLHIFKIS